MTAGHEERPPSWRPSQAAYWNGPGGQGWLEARARLDRSLVEIGRRALALADARSGRRRSTLVAAPAARPPRSRKSVGPDGHVLGVDISRPLIEAAKARRLANATFLVADATTHPFEAASFDLVFSRFGVMFFGDPVVAAFTNLRRP